MPTLPVLALAASLVVPSFAGRGEDRLPPKPDTSRVSTPFTQIDPLGMGFNLRLMAARTFAFFEPHGGLTFSAIAGYESGPWVAGVQASRVNEFEVGFSWDPHEPAEHFLWFGGFGGRVYRSRKAAMTVGLGAGWLSGEARGAVESTFEACRNGGWGGTDCDGQTTYTVHMHKLEAVATPALNPLVSFDLTFSRGFGIGILLQHYVNFQQNLASAAFFLRTGF